MVKLTAGVQVSPRMLDVAEGGGVSEVRLCSGNNTSLCHFVMFKQERVFARATRWKQTIALKSAAY